MSLLLKVACPSCGFHQDSLIGTEVRCQRCGNDFRALGHGESATRIVSATSDDLEHVPYSQRSTEVPRSTASALVVADPDLLDDRLLRDLPLKDNARWAGRVRLIKKLGTGGMSAVYRGFDESLALDVAVKILPVPPGGKEAHFAEHFRQEARISAQINHPNVVRTRDVGEQGGQVYLVMDYIEGQTARQLLDHKGLIPIPQALQIAHDVSLGMQAAHERGIVHRDIKPENIIIATDGRVMLSDLGLAKASGARASDALAAVSRMGILLGTPDYMSPEQWDIGSHITPRTDIWSMGVTLWVLLTRRAPFEDADLAQLAKKIKEAPLPDIHSLRPDVPPKVASILYHCMAKNAQRRYVNAAALVSALHNAMQHPEQSDEDFSLPVMALSASTNRDSLQETRSVIVPDASTSSLPRAADYVSAKARGSVRSGSPASVKKPVQAASSKLIAPKPAAQSKLTVTRVLAWIALPALAACAIFAVYRNYAHESLKTGGGNAAALGSAVPKEPVANLIVTPPRPVSSDLELEVTGKMHGKPGEKAVLSAFVKGAEDPSKLQIVWKSQNFSDTGTDLAIQFDTDREYDVLAVTPDGKTRAGKHIKVETDLAVTVLEVVSTEADAALHFEGTVRGGGGPQNTEVRWVDKKNLNVSVCDKLIFEPTEKEVAAGTTRVFLFQARRKGARDWVGAPQEMVPVAMKLRVPSEYLAAIGAAEKALKAEESAPSGTAASAALKEALTAFDKASKLYPKGEEALTGSVECSKRMKKEEEYARLVSESERVSYDAERITSSDPVARLEAFTNALIPISQAQAIFNRPEAANERKRLDQQVADCRAEIENVDKARKAFDSRVARARGQVREAEKYQNLSVALPHWEDALDSFKKLSTDYPKRTDEFALDMKRAQENHDKAYLVSQMGIVPARPEDHLYDLPKPKRTATQSVVPNLPVPTGEKKETGRLLEP